MAINRIKSYSCVPLLDSFMLSIHCTGLVPTRERVSIAAEGIRKRAEEMDGRVTGWS